MIPKFPNFKKLEVGDKAEVEELNRKFPPYSDFNFVSMWVYDTAEMMELSLLRGNLAVKFQDYLTAKPFYSFLGVNDAEKTAAELIDFSKNKLCLESLRLVPDVVVEKLQSCGGVTMKEDPDNHDYIVRITDLIELKGGKYMAKRNHIHKFEREYGLVTRVSELDIKDAEVQRRIVEIFLEWETSRGKVREDTQTELEAVRRLFKLGTINKLQCLGLVVRGKIIGFSICEILENKYAIYHFEKANVEYSGVFAYLKYKTAERLFQKGIEYWNLEQDLGDAGLRVSKSECRPVFMLKKYIVYQGSLL